MLRLLPSRLPALLSVLTTWNKKSVVIKLLLGARTRISVEQTPARVACQCFRRYRMLHSRLRIDGWSISVKRTYRVYREEGLMVRKRRRKKLPVPERLPGSIPFSSAEARLWLLRALNR